MFPVFWGISGSRRTTLRFILSHPELVSGSSKKRPDFNPAFSLFKYNYFCLPTGVHSSHLHAGQCLKCCHSSLRTTFPQLLHFTFLLAILSFQQKIDPRIPTRIPIAIISLTVLLIKVIFFTPKIFFKILIYFTFLYFDCQCLNYGSFTVCMTVFCANPRYFLCSRSQFSFLSQILPDFGNFS